MCQTEQLELIDKMLIILLITAALQPTLATDFLKDCPVERDLRVEGDLVLDVLQTFYRDLEIVGARAGAREARNYQPLSTEMHYDYPEGTSPWSSLDIHQFFDTVIDLLQQNRIDRTKRMLDGIRFLRQFESGIEMTYMQYFQAEVNRILGKNRAAASAILTAYSERRSSVGISVNQLVHLDGLIALQKLSSFNRRVDRLHGLSISPDYKLLSLLHLMTKGEVMPLKELRTTVFNQLSELQRADPMVGSKASTSSASPKSSELKRVDPDQDDFTGETVSNEQVEGIMCEFAQKLSLLEVSSREGAPADYSSVLGQLRQLDADFADKLDADIVNNLDANHELAKQKADEIWSGIVEGPDLEGNKELFMSYFNTELIRRSTDQCDLWALQSMQMDVGTVKNIRKELRGISLDKMAEMDARVVLMWLKCFHKRVVGAYELDGSEDEQQLKEKKSRLGTCSRTLTSEALSG